MKVLLVNGSPNKEGCTYTALNEVANTLNEEGVETEILWLGKKPIGGCIACETCGETGKNAQIGTVYAYEHTDAPVKNPTVTVGDESITFNCTMASSDYLEYDPATSKAVLYHNTTQTTEEVGVSGSLSIAKGDFTATYTAEAQTEAPVRARVVLGFAGQEITN